MEPIPVVSRRHDFGPGYFTEDEISVQLRAIFQVLDVPRRISEPAGKTILIDLFGTANAGKTRVTGELERIFRREGYNILCPPETAEIDEVRNKSVKEPFVFQARHLTGVIDYVINLANNRDYHAAIISRGLIDMLYWYEKGTRDGIYSAEQQKGIQALVYDLLRQDLVDAFFFFTCSPEVAMQREYGESLTKKLGSNMNPTSLAKARGIYESVLEGVHANVPGLPIFHVDTSDLKIDQVAQEIVQRLLPTIHQRFSVPDAKIFVGSPSLMQKRASTNDNFEEQIKLRGHPRLEKIFTQCWEPVDQIDQVDLYYNLRPEAADSDGFFSEICRVRREGGRVRFMFKGRPQDRIFSHRRPLQFDIGEEDADVIAKTYPQILRLEKRRLRYRLEREPSKSEGHFFSMHVDTVPGLGAFTEIRARGTFDRTHTAELLDLAGELGFTISDIVEGSSYMALALAKSK
jgi:adenylate cyclase class IV